MTELDSILGHFPEARRKGDGWRAKCPAHDGQSAASLSVKVGTDGRALLHCFSGCTAEAIVAAVGLSMRDLMPQSNGGGHHSNGTAAAPPKPKGRVYSNLADAIAAAEQATGGTVGGHWIYPHGAAEADASACVARFNLPDGAKTFRPLHHAADGWRFGDPPGKWPIYGKVGPRTFLVEGEKCCDALLALGLDCITSAHGADGAALTDWGAVRDAEIIALPDHDAKGETYVARVATTLRGQGCTVRVIRLVGVWPEMPQGGDIADMLAESGPWAEREDADVRDALEELAEAAPEWTPAGDAPRASRLIHRRMSDVAFEPTEWLWCNRFPMGALSILFGNPDAGKTTAALDIAAHVSRGIPFADGSPCPSGRVLVLSAEDDPARTLRPRLEAAGADLDRIYIIEATRDATTNDGEASERPFDMQRDLIALAALMNELRDVRLAVVDPLNGYMGDGVNSWRDSDVRRVLHPVVALAMRCGASIIGIMHPNKNKGDGPAQYSLGGTVAFPGVARAVWQVVRDEHDERRRLMLRAKCNLAPEDIGGLGFTIAGATNGAAVIQWQPEAIQQSADQWRAEHRKADREPSDVERCAVWLAERLEHRPVDAKWLYDEADNGQGFRRHTLDRAANRLGVERRKVGVPGEAGKWTWHLPQGGAK